MELNVSHLERTQVFNKVLEFILAHNFTVVSKDFSRPWGGFFVIEESQAKTFAKKFFPNVDFDSLKLSEKLSPKFLIVAPQKRLSWQYHHRRAEIWTVLDGTVGVVNSDTDEEGELKQLQKGDQIKLHQGERHRLVGLNDWSVLAEIWQHIDSNNPSNEEDIVRVQDDFGR
jgi:mannose-6-phosphate isomerase-like protein (cupin superfamily)